MYKYLDKGFLGYVFVSLPYFWIVLLVSFLIIACYDYRHTNEGYRYKTYLIVLGSVIISVVIGTSLFFLGFGDKMEQKFAENLPSYNRFMQRRMKMWNQPEKGLLVGEIIGIEKENILRLKDFNNNIWSVNIKNAKWRRCQRKELGRRIKIIGVKSGDNKFIAQEIGPWVRRIHNFPQHIKQKIKNHHNKANQFRR